MPISARLSTQILSYNNIWMPFIYLLNWDFVCSILYNRLIVILVTILNTCLSLKKKDLNPYWESNTWLTSFKLLKQIELNIKEN